MENSLKITKPLNAVIIDTYKLENDTIKQDTELFCGQCGEQMGKLKEDLKFPFFTADLAEALVASTFRSTPFGIIHKTCGHVIRNGAPNGLKRNIRFITRDTFEAEQAE